MAKKSKDEAPNPQAVVNRDIIQRMNFLYQASGYLASINQLSRPDVSKSESKAKTKPRLDASHISSDYIEMMKDPAVKRTICKGCNSLLRPGITASVRVRTLPSHGHALTYTCKACKTSRMIPAPPTLEIGTQEKTETNDPKDTEMQDNGDSTSVKHSKRLPRPRHPPLFARKVGHVVFKGNQKLSEQEQDGLFAV
ncbi:hypothetical protein ONZ45_g4362 [Pleurotus djamor]|nr:hypothetical protein ONZ45_g4362 [Pleurotus djamor]